MKKRYLKTSPKYLSEKSVKLILDLASQKNNNSWIVGGAIRDFLLGKEVSDIDFVTDTQPLEMLKIFKKNDVKVEEKFINYGVLKIKINNKKFEITSLRDDYEYDGRHSKVKFVKDLKIDASRRDLTINSLYLNKKAEIFDFYDGLNDLRDSKLKFIGDIEKKCFEDHLRILRYCRFCSLFEKPIIPNHYKEFLKKNSLYISKISTTKFVNELKKIFNNKYFMNSILLLKELEIDKNVLKKKLENEVKFYKKIIEHLT